MSRYAMEWAKQLDGSDPKVRLVMLVLADDAQGRDHKVRIYGDGLECKTGLTTGEADAAVRRAQAAGLVAVREFSDTVPFGTSSRRVRDFALLISDAFRTQMTPRPKKDGVDLEDVPTAAYRLYNAEGVLAYVGVSDQPEVRFTQHEASQPWWREVVTREITWHGSRRSALAEEERAIEQDDPLYNDDGAPGRRRASGYPRKTRYVVLTSRYAKFLEIKKLLWADIRRGMYDTGALPTVDDLEQRYLASPAVMRQVLHHLERDEVLQPVDENRTTWVWVE